MNVSVEQCLTFTGLLSRLEAVPCSAHAGSGCMRRRETQLRAVAIVVTAQVDTRYRKGQGSVTGK